MDNRGNRVILTDSESAINIPAVGAALSTKRYIARASDELSFDVCVQIIISFVKSSLCYEIPFIDTWILISGNKNGSDYAKSVQKVL